MASLAAALLKAKSGGKLRAKKKAPKNPPSASKAAEMLHDGTTHGKPITDRQRRYFGFLAGKGD